MQQTTSVVSAAGDEVLARAIASKLGAQFISAEVKVFSDGESKVRIPAKMGGSCIIVQSTSPPTDTNLMKLLMMATRCFEDGCQDICAIVPYLGYARQDRAFLHGEIATIALISKLFVASGIKHVITVDIHSDSAISCFRIGVSNVSAIPLLAAYARNLHLDSPIVISPDMGGQARAKQFAEILQTDSYSFKKTRNRETGEITIFDDLGFSFIGRDCVIVDDMISSGGSIVEAANLLHKRGASKIFVFCTHAVLVDNADARIKSAGVSDLVATNSIPGAYSKVDLSATLAETARAYLAGLA